MDTRELTTSLIKTSNSLQDDSDTFSFNTAAIVESLSTNRNKQLSRLESIRKDYYYLHTSMLYKRDGTAGSDCENAWNTFVKGLCSDYSKLWWKELGKALGVLQDDLNYIESITKDCVIDPTDLLLKCYMRYDESATIDKILEALHRIGRYDLITKMESPLQNIAQHFSKEITRKKIISCIDRLDNDLPSPLRKGEIKQLRSNGFKECDLATILLTFEEDGLVTAHDIIENNNWCEIFTLEDLRLQDLVNPVPIIRDCITKVDFVVPIVTAGYLSAIQPYKDNYTKLIYDEVHPSKFRSVYDTNNADLYKKIVDIPRFSLSVHVHLFCEQFKMYWERKLKQTVDTL